MPLTQNEIAELKALMAGFGQTPEVHETIYQHSKDDDIVIAHVIEDEPTIMLSIPDDDEWREQFANLVFKLWTNRTTILHVLQREPLLEAFRKAVAERMDAAEAAGDHPCEANEMRVNDASLALSRAGTTLAAFDSEHPTP